LERENRSGTKEVRGNDEERGEGRVGWERGVE